MLLQGTPLLHRMLLYCSGYHIYCRGCNLLQGMQSTAGDANILLPGYHIYCRDTISTSSARVISLLLQGIPRLQQWIPHTCTAGDTTLDTSGDTTSTAGIPHLLSGYHIYPYCKGYHITVGISLLLQRIPHLLSEYHIYPYCKGYHITVGISLLLQGIPLLLQWIPRLQQGQGIPHLLPLRIPHLLQCKCQWIPHLLQGIPHLLQGIPRLLPGYHIYCWDTTFTAGIP